MNDAVLYGFVVGMFNETISEKGLGWVLFV